jgi:hypothetical protein
MDETTTDRLTIAATQLDITTDRIFQGGVTTDDLAPVAAYLTTLAEHGFQIASLALHAIDSADPQHPIHDTPHGNSAQSAISHAKALLDAGIHFACHAEHNIHAMHPDDTL